jgi:hypothetical protein
MCSSEAGTKIQLRCGNSIGKLSLSGSATAQRELRGRGRDAERLELKGRATITSLMSAVLRGAVGTVLADGGRTRRRAPSI